MRNRTRRETAELCRIKQGESNLKVAKIFNIYMIFAYVAAIALIVIWPMAIKGILAIMFVNSIFKTWVLNRSYLSKHRKAGCVFLAVMETIACLFLSYFLKQIDGLYVIPILTAMAIVIVSGFSMREFTEQKGES